MTDSQAPHQKAEAKAREKAVQGPEDTAALSPEAIRRMLDELQGHQARLEMQNKEPGITLAELKKSWNHYFDLYDLAPVGYCILSEKGLILETNLAAATLLGTARESLVKQPLTRFIFKEDQDTFYRRSKLLFDTAAPQECELRLIKADGEIFWAHLSGVKGQSEDGTPTCRVVLTDITERKQTEQYLELERKRFFRLLEAFPGFIYLQAPDYSIRYANKYFVEHFGSTKGRLCHEVMWGRNEPCDVCPTFDVFKTGTPQEWEWAEAPDGRTYTIHDYPFVDSDGTALVLEIGVDITEFKRAKQALRRERDLNQRYLDTTQTMMVALDTEGRITMMNRAGRELLGYTENEILGRNWFETCLPQPEGMEKVYPVFKRIMAGNLISVEYFENRVVCRDGTQRLIGWHNTHLKDGEGKIIGTLSSGEDITERKRVEEEILQLRKAESLGRMAGAIAHHYNNLMGIVLGCLELAADNPFDPSLVKDMVSDATTATLRAAEVSRLMLAYLGQSIGNRKPLNLSALCREIVSKRAPRLPSNVRLQARLPLDGPAILADMAQMEMVLTNLVVNASEAIGEAEGDITITVTDIPGPAIPISGIAPAGWTPKADHYACLSVSDTGCGMEPGIVEKAFDPFFSTKFAGRGLGLSVILGIVKAHEGAIAAESRLGEGSAFRVFLPISKEKPPEIQKPPALMPALVKESGLLVLMVDDEPMIRDMARQILNSMGHKVVTAANGTEAVDIFRRHKDEIHCVLCDLTMPGMSGWETLKALRQIRPDIPVILCSGYDEASVMAQEHEEQAQVFLGKPYGKATLEAALARVFGR